MKFQKLTHAKKGEGITFQQLLFLIAFALILGFAIFHLEKCLNLLVEIYALLSPFLMAVIFAFLLNIPLRFFENRLFPGRTDPPPSVPGTHTPPIKKGRRHLKRCVCILLSLLFVLGVITLILLLVVPELLRSIRSLKTLTESVPSYFDALSLRLNAFFENWNIAQEGKAPLALDWNTVLETLIGVVRTSDEQIMSVVKRVTSSFLNILISIVLSLYLLAGKEKLKKNLSSLCFAFFSRKTALRLIEVGALSNRTFSKYVTGQLLESFILGALCYIGMTILRLPFPLLISTIVAITGFIPVFGALIGGMIGALIILVINPISSLWFLIFLIILQNVEGNFIYPKVMSDCIGLPGIWVIATLFVFGKLFGLMGVFVGIPTVSVLYTLLRQQTEQRLAHRNLSPDDISDLCHHSPKNSISFTQDDS